MNEGDMARATRPTWEAAAAPPAPAGGGRTRYTVRVSPGVLATVVRRAAEETPGVVRLASAASRPRLWRGGSAYAEGGLRLSVGDGRVRVAIHLVVARDQNLHGVGAAAQERIAQALERLVGMSAATIDVYVQSVE